MDLSRGTERYQIVRELGSGGMGVVYEAIDRERGGRRVALKVLKQPDADGLARLKREFRALADVRHPNLVTLHELSAHEGTWFITLELVEGVDFLSWLRPGSRALADAPTGKLGAVDGTAPSGLELSRLVPAFRQLIEGVAALHENGRLHRDLKPSNVLVTPDGRVVILDFGLVLELEGTQSGADTSGHAIIGTAAYMAPEQVSTSATPIGPATDWYAVGVMLFQALTGRLPFEGTAVEVLLEKQRRPAPLVTTGPAELATLCAGLLRANPAERGGLSDLRVHFGGVETSKPQRQLDAPLLGRGEELATLHRALETTRGGEPLLVRLVGASGIGKSALLREFVAESGALVLSGRCYERESVPFKALDSVVDALARQLVPWPADRVDAVLPRDAAALVRMFPVLGRVERFAQAPLRDVKESAELRRRAVRALREVLARIADRQPLVLIIDDAQWGDAESAEVLEEIFRLPDAPGALLIVAAREGAHPLDHLKLQARDLPLRALSGEDSAALARRVMGASPVEARAVDVAREAGGNPFLVQQLASAGGPVSLDDVVVSRLEGLPAPARSALEVIAVASAPLPEKAARVAARLDPADVDSLELLKSARLVRSGAEDRLESWHDRVREAVVRALSPERVRELHARLAEALRGGADIDVIAWHLGAAGQVDAAATATIEAARQAAAQLAFERAGVLFERALELIGSDDLRRRELRIELAEAWASAGRGALAARAYETAAAEPGQAGASTLELRRRSAEQLLRSGHVDAGLAAVNAVLRDLGMTLAKTPKRALGALLFRRLHIWLRGRTFVETPARDVPPAMLERIDACWSVSMGLSMVDTIRGASFQARQLLLALDAGEPTRITRALAAEAAFVATAGVGAERKAAQLVAEAKELAERLGDGALIGLVEFCSGLTHFLVGRWREAAQFTAQAERRFAEVGSALSWEAANSRLFTVWSLFYLGNLSELSERIPTLTAEAEARGDRYAVTSLRCGLANVALLAKGDPEGARRAVADAMSGWSTRSFHFQHYWAALSETMIDLYEGRLEGALARMETCWRALEASQLLRIQNVRVEARSLIARVLVALGRPDEARVHAQALLRERVGWADALGALILGACGDDGELKRSIEAFDRQDMALFAAAARLRLGERQGGALGPANVRAATVWMTAQRVSDPSRLANVICPLPQGKIDSARANAAVPTIEPA